MLIIYNKQMNMNNIPFKIYYSLLLKEFKLINEPSADKDDL